MKVSAMWTALGRLWRDEEGLTSVEYAILIALLVIASVGIYAALGGRVQGGGAAETRIEGAGAITSADMS